MTRSKGSISRIRSSPPVAAARAMKLAISMWSGVTLWSAPPSFSWPSTIITLEPIPEIGAPILTSSRARSWTCGSEAALRIVVSPGVSAAAISAFSVPMTEGSSMKISAARRPPGGAFSSIQRSPPTRAPSSRKASRCASRRRRPMKSPPGGGMLTLPKRAKSGPAIRKEARIAAERSWSRVVSSTSFAQRRTVLSSTHSTVTPRAASSSICASVSRIRGTFAIVTTSSVRRQAARIGSAAFLLPAAVISPESGTPPCITNFCICFCTPRLTVFV